MNAVTPIERPDDIRTFLPGCDGEEYELRVLLRGQRNAMTRLIATTESDTARCLAWIVVEYVTANLFAPADLEWLRELRRFCHRLSLTAMQAEDIDL
jgi:hypothetical protein